jgi:hypothetical protein
MPALFPEWTNTAIRLALVGLAAVAIGIPAALMFAVRTPYMTGQRIEIDQPVEFDHRHHAQDDGIDCLYCHNEAERSPFAGIPSTALCMGCHNQIWNDSPMLEPVRRAWFSGLPIPWNRVHNMPDFVFFDHSIHVNKGIGCVSCHGRVDEMPRVYQETPMTMAWCLSCHRDPEPHLRPRDRITDMAWRPPADPAAAAALRRRLAEEYDVRRLLHCTACHR